jgi:sulfotransferase
MKKMHFISGLPRAGSTMLSAILSQNPRFTASMTDPMLDMARSVVQTIQSATGMEEFVTIEKKRAIIESMFQAYYSDGRDVCFNTNRGWAAHTPMVRSIWPNSKIILCIRDISWILDSIERINEKNPLSLKGVYGGQDLISVYERTHTVMNIGGFVNAPLACTKQAIYSNEKDMICVIHYDALTKNPENTMRQLYAFLEEPYFNHDFDNVSDNYDPAYVNFDNKLGMNGLHEVKKKVAPVNRKPILPEDLWKMYSDQSFWKNNFDHMKRQVKWIE